MKRTKFKVLSRHLLLLPVAVLGLGCASLSNVETSRFKNSALSNYNPAPKKMSPPVYDPANETVDPSYLQQKADYHFSLGEALSLDGNTEKAIEEFKLTTVYDAKSPVVKKRLAEEYLKQGLLSEAIEQAEAATKLDPDYVEAYLLLGQLYQTLRMYRQSKRHYEKILEIQPNNMQAYIFLGSLFADQEKFDEAEKYFLKVVDHPENKKPYLTHYYIGTMRMKQGGAVNLKRAASAFSKGLGLRPDDEDLAMGLAQVYETQGRQEKAVQLMSSFQERFGPRRIPAEFLAQYFLEKEKYEKAYEQLQVIEGFRPGDLNVKMKMALILIEKKDYQRAIPKLEQIVAMVPESDKIRFYLGAVYEETNKPLLAIRHFLKVEPLSSYYADATIHAAYIYKKQKQFEKAAKLIEGAIDLRSDVPHFYSFYASLMDETKEYKKAIKVLSAGVEKFPSNTQLRFFLGSMHDRVGNSEGTIVEMKKVLDIDANHVQAMNYLAYTYAELNLRLEEAEALARRALDLKPGDGYVLDTLGWVLFKRGNTQEAIQFLEAAYKTKASEAVVAEHLGDAYYSYDLVNKAKTMYLRAVQIEQDKDKIRKIRKKLANINEIQQRRPASARSK